MNIGQLAAPAVERFAPARHRDAALRAIDRIQAVIEGRDDSALSQRTAIFAFSIRVVSAALAYVSQVLMARWMGDFEYGVFVSVWVAIVILGGLSCLGFQTGVIRFISEYETLGMKDHLRGAIRGALGWSFALATLLAVAGAGLVFVFEDSLTGYYVLPFYLVLICLPMLALQEVQDGVARAYDWPGAALMPTFVLRPILILAAMWLATRMGFAADAPTAVACAVGATWIATLIQFTTIMRRLWGVLPSGPRIYLPRQWLAVALPIFMIEGFYNLLTNTDILFVGYYLEPEKVAVYFATVKTLALVHFVYFAVKAGSAHRFASYLKAGDTERYERFVQETVQWTFWPSLAMAAVMVLLGKYFLMLFGPAFTHGESLLWILAGGVIVRASVGAAETVLTMSGEQRICALVYGVTLALNVALNMTLIPRMGLEGAAAATSLALVFEAVALYTAARLRLGLHIFIVPRRRAVPAA